MNRHDRRLWASARTLADLGELTAQWLEGRIASVPGYCGGPAEETRELIPVLAACNRAGFVTDCSQPGGSGPGWEQRAAAEGFADDLTADVLGRLGAVRGVSVVVSRPSRRRIRYDNAVPVTCHDGQVFTRFGAVLPRRHLRDSWVGYGTCHREAVAALCDAWQVTITDPEWGRNDRLWPVLAEFAGVVTPL